MDSRPSDEMLLLAVAKRDVGAFRTLYERHAGWLAIRRLVSRLALVFAASTWVSPLASAVAVSLFVAVLRLLSPFAFFTRAGCGRRGFTHAVTA